VRSSRDPSSVAVRGSRRSRGGRPTRRLARHRAGRTPPWWTPLWFEVLQRSSACPLAGPALATHRQRLVALSACRPTLEVTVSHGASACPLPMITGITAAWRAADGSARVVVRPKAIESSPAFGCRGPTGQQQRRSRNATESTSTTSSPGSWGNTSDSPYLTTAGPRLPPISRSCR
jgi:hypothetical protein